jgi:drug/metabolite transporter (DMT)-like permease
MRPAEWAMLGTLSVLWGGSFFFVGVAVGELPPLTIVLARVGIASLALWCLLAVTRTRIPRGATVWAASFGMGLLNNAIPFALIVWGQQHIASGLAAILNATTPLFTVLVAHALTEDEKLTAGRAAGVLLGFAGVVVMLGPELPGGFGTALAAQLACLGAALSYALAGVFGRRFHRMGIPPLATAAGQVTATSAMLLPAALLLDAPWTLAPPAPGTWAALAGLGVLSTGLAYLLYFRILAVTGATNLLLVTLLIPVSAVLLGVLFLGERFVPGHAAGMALIGLGLGAIDGRPLRVLSSAGSRPSRRPAGRTAGTPPPPDPASSDG